MERCRDLASLFRLLRNGLSLHGCDRLLPTPHHTPREDEINPLILVAVAIKQVQATPIQTGRNHNIMVASYMEKYGSLLFAFLPELLLHPTLSAKSSL